MQQHHYDSIIACIKYGAPALADNLIVALNKMVKLANERTEELQAQNEVEPTENKK